MLPDNGNTLNSDDSFPPEKDLDATNDLYTTIKSGTAKLESLKLLVDGFEILEELGRGAYGVVYRARDEKLDRQVAIKISLLDDPSRREQYVKEAKNAAKLDTEGIVPVFQVGTLAGGQPFVVQRLINGDTLRKVLAECGTLNVHQACWLMAEIASAVAKAHTVGMIHRDLKPDNILVDSAGKPWVADFGLAILEEDQSQHRGEKAGTPLYMSPEQLRGRTEWLDGRADIYAMGIMLYEMLVGRTPFEARNLAELEEQVLHRDPKPISQRSPNIPAVMDIIFQNCCAKQVNDRYSNANEFVADLESVMTEFPESEMPVTSQSKVFASASASRKSMSQVGVSTRRKTLRSTIRETNVQQSRRYTTPLIMAGVVGILALGGYALWKLNPKPEPVVVAKDQGGTGASDIPAVPENKIPERPFRVSKGGLGTHASIQAAIAMAEAGETITILEGNYTESLVLDQNITLVGEGDNDIITIVGQDKVALAVQGNAMVELRNLTLEGEKSGDSEFNTIEVNSGMLTIKGCNVYTRSYDGVKLQPNSSLKATSCNFRSTAHPAIYAKEAAQLEVVGCTFEVKALTLEGKSIPVGIQANNCAGLVSACSFSGSGASYGIHWKDSEGLVVIEDAVIENCGIGILLQDCRNVQIKGTAATKISGCDEGILLQRCAANIQYVDINSAQGKLGIRVLDSGDVQGEPAVTIADCNMSGFDVSLSVENSNVSVRMLRSISRGATGIQLIRHSKFDMSENSSVTNSDTGVLIQDAIASFTSCDISSNSIAGFLVDTGPNNLNCTDCTISNNAVGMMVHSGTVKLGGGVIEKNAAGLLVVSRDEMSQKGSEGAVIEPIFLDLTDVMIRENENGGFLIRHACSFRISGGKLEDPESDNQPRVLLKTLKSKQDGEWTVVTAEPP